jgi:hypothetical protein
MRRRYVSAGAMEGLSACCFGGKGARGREGCVVDVEVSTGMRAISIIMYCTVHDQSPELV